MTMMEDWICKNCNKNHFHLCNTVESIEKEYGLHDCPYCNAKNVNIKHLCKRKVKELTHICTNCGRVSDNPEYLCNPVPIEEVTKAEWKKISEKEGDLKLCHSCRQPIHGRGHLCDPKVPYTCEYCGKQVSDEMHFCKEQIEKAKYFCNLCGRLAVKKDEICAGWKLP